MSRPSREFEPAPTAEEAEKLVKRMSAGANVAEGHAAKTSAKEEEVLKVATFSLQKYLKDPEFAAEFLDRGGLQSLCNIIRNKNGNTLAYALNSFASLLTHDACWDSLTADFVDEVARIVVSETLVTICRPATAILIKIVSAERPAAPYTPSSDNPQSEVAGYSAIHRVLQNEPELLPVLIQRLQSPDYTLCLNSLTLLTALLKNVTDEHRSELLEGIERGNVRKYVLQLMNGHPSDELKEQILEFQAAFIHNIHRRRKTQISMHNPRHVQMLNAIWEAAGVADVQLPGARKWRKLGFSSEVPNREFGRTGVFGLERMHAFATQNQDMFAKMILEQIHRPEGKRCPFAKASIEVTELLCSHWNISTGYIAADFEPLLLHFDYIQSTTLQCFYRIFQEMEATTADFSKVSALVRSQLRATLKSDGIKDIYEFNRIMLDTPYTVIRDRRLKELEWADDLLGREAIRNLRARLNRQSYDFIKRQRISCLLQGAWFPCPASAQRSASAHASNAISSTNTSSTLNTSTSSALNVMQPSSTAKRWRYYKLSPSKKVLQFGDFSDKLAPIIHNYDQLTGKVDLSAVSDIKTFSRKVSNAGMAVPSLSSSANSSAVPSLSEATPGLSFALVGENGAALAEFVCSSSAQASEWRDGFSLLLDKGISSKETAEYLHSLTEIGVKVKLLQIAGDRVEVPHGHLEPPSVPNGLGTGFFYSSA